MLRIDLNCDLGEGMPHDASLMEFISSANIACGGHAGDIDSVKRTVDLALTHGVAIGAHPSYPDRTNFGRKDLLDSVLQPEQLPALIVAQVSLLQRICSEFGTRIHHVKPHGALYNRAARDHLVAELICQAIIEIDPTFVLYGLSGSCMREQALKKGIVFANEVFADRTYQANGSLTPREMAGALIEDDQQSIAQVMQIIKQGSVTSISGDQVSINAETICLHGDGKHAVPFAKMIRDRLNSEGIAITSSK